MKLNSSVSGDGKVDSLKVSQSKLSKALSAGGFVIESFIVNEIDQLGLVNTGTFKAGVHSGLPVGNKVEVTDSVKYGIYLEYGTRPHIIKPRNAKALHWKSGEGSVFAKKVRHPGTREYRPFTKGLIKSQDSVLKVVEEVMM